MASVVRPMPGVRFERRPPSAVDVLPRMDVALFVGFAASGPLHRPVAVEDVAQFTAVFGEDAPLAWDVDRGEQLFAYLAPAVRAFFRNGGRRCWVVRVADQAKARSNVFPLAGCLSLHDGRLTPAFVRARSEGSWSDGIRVGTALEMRPVEVSQAGPEPWAQLAISIRDVATGDVLRIEFGDDTVLVMGAEAIIPADESPPSNNRGVIVAAGAGVWLGRGMPNGVSGPGTGLVYPGGDLPPVKAPVLNAPATWPVNGLLSLDLELPVADAPEPGTPIAIEVAGHMLWLTVRSVGLSHGPGGDEQVVTVVGSGWWLLSGPPMDASPPLTPTGAQILRLTLVARAGDDEQRATGLALAPRHPQSWNALPTDAERLAEPSGTATAGSGAFPLAGSGAASDLLVPIDVDVLVGPMLGPIRQGASALDRDGLADYGPELFLDAALAAPGVATLLSTADFIRYEGEPPRKLRGIHTVFDLDEATLVVAPDVVHRGWSRRQPEPAPRPPQTPPPVRPEWWHFRDCSDATPLPAVSEPNWGEFLSCGIVTIPAPNPVSVTGLSARTGTYTVVWSAGTADRYVLEESHSADFPSEATFVAYEGPNERATFYSRAIGTYYYRVRAERGGQTSDWSESLVVQLTPSDAWIVRPAADFAPQTLLQVQRAMLRACAARGDMLAVLAMPEHYREAEALDHVSTLTDDPDGSARFGALYHPWPVGRDPGEAGEVRRVPPDGAACGVIARRTLARGAWIAPANEPFAGLIALTPRLASASAASLRGEGLNVITQEPRGFLALSEDTLTRDAEVRPINVRRLLSLVRRAALRLGATYVFEPNDDAFRRLIRRGFESMLDGMFLRGAFAGATASSSYQVVVGPELNTPASVDQGRLIVEIRIAPSLPLTFLTIRLVQHGDRTVVTEGR